MGPQLKVPSNRLKKLLMEPATPGLQGEWFIHCITVAPDAFIDSTQLDLNSDFLPRPESKVYIMVEHARIQKVFSEWVQI